MLIDIVNSTSPEDKVRYILIVSIVIYFFSVFTYTNISTIIGILVSFIIILYLIELNNTDISSFHKDTEYKLKSLYIEERIPEYMAGDANMIELFTAISDYKDYNYSIYEKLLDRTNQFLQLKDDVEIGTMLSDYDFETAHGIYRNCMNYMRSFKHSLPMTLYDNHDIAEKRYQVLMKRNLDVIINIVKNTPYNIHKKSTYYYDTVRPTDSYNEDDLTSFGAY